MIKCEEDLDRYFYSSDSQSTPVAAMKPKRPTHQDKYYVNKSFDQKQMKSSLSGWGGTRDNFNPSNSESQQNKTIEVKRKKPKKIKRRINGKLYVDQSVDTNQGIDDYFNNVNERLIESKRLNMSYDFQDDRIIHEKNMKLRANNSTSLRRIKEKASNPSTNNLLSVLQCYGNSCIDSINQRNMQNKSFDIQQFNTNNRRFLQLMEINLYNDKPIASYGDTRYQKPLVKHESFEFLSNNQDLFLNRSDSKQFHPTNKKLLTPIIKDKSDNNHILNLQMKITPSLLQKERLSQINESLSQKIKQREHFQQKVKQQSNSLLKVNLINNYYIGLLKQTKNSVDNSLTKLNINQNSFITLPSIKQTIDLQKETSLLVQSQNSNKYLHSIHLKPKSILQSRPQIILTMHEPSSSQQKKYSCIKRKQSLLNTETQTNRNIKLM